MMTDKLSRLTFAIIITIFGVSFVLSYVALQDVAARYGAAGWWSFGWPLLIDLPLVAFSLSAIRSALSGLSTNRQWSMVGLYTLATIGFNLAHAQSSWMGWAVAIVPPVTLFLSFETAMQMVRQDIERQDRQSFVRPVVADPKLEPERTKDEPTRTEPEQADYKTAIFAALDEQPERTTTELAELVGCAKSTASKWANKYTNGAN